MDESRKAIRFAALAALAFAVCLGGTVVRAQGVRSNPVERPLSMRPALDQTRPVAAPSTSPTSRPASRDSTSPAPRLTLKRPESSSGPSESSRPASPWWTVLALVFVVGLVLALARIWRKHVPGASAHLPGEAVEILGRRPLSPREAIQLVRIGSRILVLGSSADGLRPLAEIDDPVEVDVLAGMCRTSNDDSPVIDSFRDWFRRATSGSTSPSATEAEPVPRTSTPETPASRGAVDLRQRLSERLHGRHQEAHRDQ